MGEWQRPVASGGFAVRADERAERGQERAAAEQRAEEYLELRLDAVFAGFRARLLSLSTMGWPLRLLTILVIALVVAIGALIGLRGLLPLADVRFGGGQRVPRAILIGGGAALALAWGLLLTGALHARWYLRFPALAAFTLLALSQAGGSNALDAARISARGVQDALAALAPLQYASLAALWAWGVALGLLGAWASRRRPRRAHPTAPAAGVTLPLALLAVVGVAAPIALPALSGGDPAPAANLMAGQVELLFLLLIPAFLLAGMHFADSGHEVAAHLAAAIARNRVSRPLIALTALAAAGICVRLGLFELPALVDGYAAGYGLGPAAGAALLLAGAGVAVALAGALLIALVGWLGRLARWPRLHVPTDGLLAVMGAVWLVLLALAAASGGRLGGAPRDATLAVLGALLLIVALGAAVVLGIRGGSRAGGTAITALFALVASLAAPYLGFHLGNLLPGFELLVAPATLVTLLWLALRRRLGARSIELVRLLFVLNVGLQVVDAIGRVYLGSSSAGSAFGVAQGVFFVFAFLWRLLLSGEHVTNVEGRIVPRYVRVLVYLGYSLLLATVVLFLSAATATDPAVGALGLTPLFDNHLYARAGLELLGVPLLVTLFVLGVCRWRGQRTPPSASGTRFARPPRRVAPATSIPRAEGGPRPILPPGRHAARAAHPLPLVGGQW